MADTIRSLFSSRRSIDRTIEKVIDYYAQEEFLPEVPGVRLGSEPDGRRREVPRSALRQVQQARSPRRAAHRRDQESDGSDLPRPRRRAIGRQRRRPGLKRSLLEGSAMGGLLDGKEAGSSGVYAGAD